MVKKPKIKKKIKKTKQEILNHLREHINYLSRSAALFDEGIEEEAKRIAVSLRVLMHQTKTSHSILNQINQKVSIYGTALKYDPVNLLTHLGLTAMSVSNEEAKYVAPLSNRSKKQIGFQQWWNEVVIVDNKKNRFTRKDLVLVVANQDGGAHVDPEIDETYAMLSKGITAGWAFKKGEEETPLEHIVLVSIRQICYEVLFTFQRKFPEYFNDEMVI